MILVKQTETLVHDYNIYIAVWTAISIFLLWFFRFMYKKMRETEDRQTKSSLFFITMFFGIPLMLAAVVGPLFFLIGDKNMSDVHRYIWIGLITVFLFYFFVKQTGSKQKTRH